MSEGIWGGGAAAGGDWSGSEKLLKIARVLKPNGANGEIILGFREYFPEDLNTNEPVFIFYDGLPVPFFMESFIPKGGSKALVRLTGFNSLEDALEAVGKEVYAKESKLSTQGRDEWEDFSGWTLLDENGKKLGIVAGLEDIPGNPCLQVRTEKGMALIPLHEDFIVNLNPDLREIKMLLPKGLL